MGADRMNHDDDGLAGYGFYVSLIILLGLRLAMLIQIFKAF